jgi:hypothetical protein
VLLDERGANITAHPALLYTQLGNPIGRQPVVVVMAAPRATPARYSTGPDGQPDGRLA